MQPVPIERVGEAAFAAVDVGALQARLDELLARHADFFPVEPNTLRVGHRRASENYTAHPFYFDSPEWVEVRINRTTSTVRLAACLGDRARADAALDLVIGAFELTTAGEIERKQRLARLRGLAGRLDHLRSDAALTPQARGKRFESWLVDLFDLYGLEANPDVQNPEEQIDFMLTVSDADLAAILRGEPELPEWLTRALRARFEHPFGDT